jgi:hypothetical protein
VQYPAIPAHVPEFEDNFDDLLLDDLEQSLRNTLRNHSIRQCQKSQIFFTTNHSICQCQKVKCFWRRNTRLDDVEKFQYWTCTSPSQFVIRSVNVYRGEKKRISTFDRKSYFGCLSCNVYFEKKMKTVVNCQKSNSSKILILCINIYIKVLTDAVNTYIFSVLLQQRLLRVGF